MALIELQRWLPDDARMRNWWTLHHSEDHKEIVQAILAQKSISLTMYQLEPYNEQDKNGWLIRHQQMHDDFNAVLGLPGNNLENINPDKDRETLAIMHFKEHYNARALLGI